MKTRLGVVNSGGGEDSTSHFAITFFFLVMDMNGGRKLLCNLQMCKKQRCDVDESELERRPFIFLSVTSKSFFLMHKKEEK